ncbi:hypothetical protein CDAR_226191 [Caerostris darwini]|uniref:Uncharacterized protein n=1 Tax=Caerostris darwini TaxID=1538125 RepID=A0AAV4ULB5_9ARAC|nr:hypothetical protein CDAR_226191 [Caerostris darwini]
MEKAIFKLSCLSGGIRLIRYSPSVSLCLSSLRSILDSSNKSCNNEILHPLLLCHVRSPVPQLRLAGGRQPHGVRPPP